MEEAGQDVPAWLRGEADRLARHQERRREEGIPDNPRGGRGGGGSSAGGSGCFKCGEEVRCGVLRSSILLVLRLKLRDD